MKSLKNLKKIPTDRVLSIDPASHSIAFAVTEYGEKIVLCGAGKISFPKEASIQKKLAIVGAVIPLIIETYKPTRAVVEETVYLQNPNTTRILAYFAGHIMGSILREKIPTVDVAPMRWKPGIGYKNVTKREQATWELSPTETKKKAAFERKDRVARIMRENFQFEANDYDVWDAIGIGWFAITKGYGK